MVTGAEPYLVLQVTRADLLNEVLEELSLYEEDSECLQTLRVNFLDMSGTREASVDDGGPGREFACIAAQQLRTSEYMEGIVKIVTMRKI